MSPQPPNFAEVRKQGEIGEQFAAAEREVLAASTRLRLLRGAYVHHLSDWQQAGLDITIDQLVGVRLQLRGHQAFITAEVANG